MRVGLATIAGFDSWRAALLVLLILALAGTLRLLALTLLAIQEPFKSNACSYLPVQGLSCSAIRSLSATH
jgi:hypothetical protein